MRILCLFLAIYLPAVQASCQTEQVKDRVDSKGSIGVNSEVENKIKRTPNKMNQSDNEIRMAIISRDFYEGDETYKWLMSLPKKKLVPMLQI